MGVIACKFCALVIDLRKYRSAWGLFWFSVKNYVNSATIFEFYSRGVLPPVWVSIVFTPFFVSVIVMIHFPGCNSIVDNGMVIYLFG
jgi:hypothetical protein